MFQYQASNRHSCAVPGNADDFIGTPTVPFNRPSDSHRVENNFFGKLFSVNISLGKDQFSWKVSWIIILKVQDQKVDKLSKVFKMFDTIFRGVLKTSED